MADYLKRINEDTWHWCKDCDKYPTGNTYIIEHSKPKYGELCDQCLALEKMGDCEK